MCRARRPVGDDAAQCAVHRCVSGGLREVGLQHGEWQIAGRKRDALLVSSPSRQLDTAASADRIRQLRAQGELRLAGEPVVFEPCLDSTQGELAWVVPLSPGGVIGEADRRIVELYAVRHDRAVEQRAGDRFAASQQREVPLQVDLIRRGGASQSSLERREAPAAVCEAFESQVQAFDLEHAEPKSSRQHGEDVQPSRRVLARQSGQAGAFSLLGWVDVDASPPEPQAVAHDEASGRHAYFSLQQPRQLVLDLTPQQLLSRARRGKKAGSDRAEEQGRG